MFLFVTLAFSYNLCVEKNQINCNKTSENLKTLFSDVSSVNNISETYYCLSNKSKGCQDYKNYDLKYINSVLEITSFPNVVIVDSSLPQLLTHKPNNQNMHIICLPGSDFTYYPRYISEFYVILKTNSIEMKNVQFSGGGNFTLINDGHLYIHSVTNINKNNLTIKSRDPLDYSTSRIYAYDPNSQYNIDKKINVPKYCILHGDKNLAGLFEADKFISQDSLIENNVTNKTLKEYPYNYFKYYFKEGNHDIPVSFSKKSQFIGNNNTNFTFHDVHCFKSDHVDNFIHIYQYNTIIINPSNYFYFVLNLYNSYNIIINVDHDFFIKGNSVYNPENDPSEIDPMKEKCKIKGNGTIKFSNNDFMNDIKSVCSIESSVKLEINPSYKKPYICIGKSSLDKCKDEIENISSINSSDWIWFRNINTNNNFDNKISYVTGNQILSSVSNNMHLVLTPKTNVIYREKYNIDYFYYYFNNSINAQKNSATFTVLYYYDEYSYNYYGKMSLAINYNSIPKGYDFNLYFYYEFFKLHTYYIEDYKENSISLNGKCIIYIREPILQILNIFKHDDQIKFVINPDKDYSQLCYANYEIECKNLNDFVIPKNYSEFVEFESASRSCSIHLYKNISFDLNSYHYVHNSFNCQNQNYTVSIDLPNNSRILFHSSTICVFAHNRKFRFNVNSRIVNFIFDVKNKVSIDYSRYGYFWKQPFSITSKEKVVEIIPNPRMKKMDRIYISNDFKIESPVPQLLNKLIGSNICTQSKSWTYIYLSEEGKKLYENFPALLINNFINDSGIKKNIVLAAGANDTILIPKSWKYNHNLYILQENNNMWGDQPTELNYLDDGLILNNKIKVSYGDIIIYPPNSFVVDANITIYYTEYELMYSALINCSINSETFLYPRSIYCRSISTDNVIIISGLSQTNKLNIKSKESDNVHYLNYILNVRTSPYVKYTFLYDYICYYPKELMNSKCIGDRFEASNTDSLLLAIKDNPEIPIYMGQNLYIPEPNKFHFILYPKEENVTITLPYSPSAILISENDVIQVNYSDSTLVDILNTSIINVKLLDSLELNIESETDSLLSFLLGSDVFLTTKTENQYNFSISVDNNRNKYKLCSENVSQFNNIFGSSLKPFMQLCAYDSDAISFCSYKYKKEIEQAFAFPFLYTEVEISLLNNPKEIRLAYISAPVDVHILSNSSATLRIITGSYIQFSYQKIIINEFWNFDGDLKVLNIDLDLETTISIIEQISEPIIFNLFDSKYEIYLNDCIKQDNSQITFINHENSEIEITVFGNQQNYDNFMESIKEHENISFIINGTQMYLCVCNESTCNKCKEDVDGFVKTTPVISNDPGENIKLRIFKDCEISSHLFINENEVYVDPEFQLNLTDVEYINESIEEGLKADNLFFKNVSNLLIKPKGPELTIVLNEKEQGPHISIEIDSFLRLNVPNYDKRNIYMNDKAPRLYARGQGELNIYDYPSTRIRANSSFVRVIKGVYVICGAKDGNNVCSYQTDEKYKTLNVYNSFNSEFDPDSKIVVFLNTFSNDLDADIQYLKGQKISFMRKTASLKPQEEQIKVRFFPTSELISKSDLSTELINSFGGALLNSSDSDLFIVGFNENLTIKQDGNISSNSSVITLRPITEKSTIIVDESVELEKQKIQIETKNENPISVKIIANINNSSEIENNFINADPTKIIVTVGDEEISPSPSYSPSQSPSYSPSKSPSYSPSKSPSHSPFKSPSRSPSMSPSLSIKIGDEDKSEKNKKIPKIAIIGIILAVIIIIGIIVLLIIVFIMKNKKELIFLDNSSEDSPSLGL